jgi:hypothetical protein
MLVSKLETYRCMRRLGEKMPEVLDHQQRNLVFDGDHALLHIQVRTCTIICGGRVVERLGVHMHSHAACQVLVQAMWLGQQGCEASSTSSLQSCKVVRCCLQERIAEREAAQPGGSWRKSYYMPTESDRCAIVSIGNLPL